MVRLMILVVGLSATLGCPSQQGRPESAGAEPASKSATQATQASAPASAPALDKTCVRDDECAVVHPDDGTGRVECCQSTCYDPIAVSKRSLAALEAYCTKAAPACRPGACPPPLSPPVPQCRDGACVVGSAAAARE